MMEPIPPTQAPTDRAHASGSSGISRSSAFISAMMMNVIVVVYGSDSRNAEPIADTHRKITIAADSRLSRGTWRMMLDMCPPMKRMRPISESDSTKTNSPAKKSRVSHSTAAMACRMSCRLVAMDAPSMPSRQNHEGSWPCSSKRKRPRKIPPKMNARKKSERSSWILLSARMASMSNLMFSFGNMCRKRKYWIVTASGMMTRTSGPLKIIKSLKRSCSLFPITTFGGSPISVAVPPIVAAIVSVR
mmetsp:Transcript_2318/g.6019  ORF Transcript_2318/g.6019 Transcript_2318/m.6019 type:complete len:246 (-) Transcript_2318:992-1729(-)